MIVLSASRMELPVKALVLCFAVLLAGTFASLANEPFYCAEDQSTGFDFTEGDYEPSKFKTDRFTLDIDDNLAVIVDRAGNRDVYRCIDAYKNAGYYCQHVRGGRSFNFNTKTGRFVYAKLFGYVFGEPDSVTVSLGTCTKF